MSILHKVKWQVTQYEISVKIMRKNINITFTCNLLSTFAVFTIDLTNSRAIIIRKFVVLGLRPETQTAEKKAHQFF